MNYSQFTIHVLYFFYFSVKLFGQFKISSYLCNRKTENGVIAQLVEQRTENPCVPGSIPGDTTKVIPKYLKQRYLGILLFPKN